MHPMENFSLVVPGVYRSAFPKKRNFAFLKKLGVKSILCVGLSIAVHGFPRPALM